MTRLDDDPVTALWEVTGMSHNLGAFKAVFRDAVMSIIEERERDVNMGDMAWYALGVQDPEAELRQARKPGSYIEVQRCSYCRSNVFGVDDAFAHFEAVHRDIGTGPVRIEITRR